jgi:hypothetical protein
MGLSMESASAALGLFFNLEGYVKPRNGRLIYSLFDLNIREYGDGLEIHDL